VSRENHIVELARAIQADRYPDATVIFVAGSIVRGEATPYSDLDLVVLYSNIGCAYRESFRFGGYPVEAFVHDNETLEYFFLEVDRPKGYQLWPRWLSRGSRCQDPTVCRAQQKATLIADGPPTLDVQTEQRMRYFVSDLLDDLRAPRSKDELIAK
jgi:predicted nucleotidyltransferase